MSQENVEIVRRGYAEGWIDRDPMRLLALTHDQVRLINPAEAVESGVRHGREELLDALTSLRAAFDSSTHELREVFDAGDSVVVAVKFRARGQSSGVEVVQDECHTLTFRDGKIVSFEWGRDLAAALKAVGLAE